MNAEEFCHRLGLVSLYDYERVEPHFRAAMAEARAQALREAIEVAMHDEGTFQGWQVADKLRKLAGGAT